MTHFLDGMLWSEALAQSGGAPPPSPVGLFLPILLIILVFYILLIRPQQKRLQAHQEMLASLKRGDVIVTSGGVIGKVRRILTQEGECDIEIAEGVVVRLVMASITDIHRKGKGS